MIDDDKAGAVQAMWSRLEELLAFADEAQDHLLAAHICDARACFLARHPEVGASVDEPDA